MKPLIFLMGIFLIGLLLRYLHHRVQKASKEAMRNVRVYVVYPIAPDKNRHFSALWEENQLQEGCTTVIDGELFQVTAVNEMTSGVMVTVTYIGNAN